MGKNYRTAQPKGKQVKYEELPDFVKKRITDEDMIRGIKRDERGNIIHVSEMNENTNNKKQQMEYKKLKKISIISVIAGVIIVLVLPLLLITRGYYMNLDTIPGYYLIPHTELNLVLLYIIILTFLVLVVYPILYIRKHNPNKLKN